MHALMSLLTRPWLVLLLAWSALTTAPPSTFAQAVRYDAAAETLFSSALQSYRTGHYRAAAQLFDSIIARYHDSHRSTAALIMRAKVAYLMNENYEATKSAKTLLADFPATRYRPDAELLLARVLLRIDRTDEARQMILTARRALPADAPPRLKSELLAFFDTVFTRYTRPEILTSLLNASTDPAERGYLWAAVAERELRRGNTLAAAIAVDTVAARYAAAVGPETVARLRADLSGAKKARVAVLLPLLRASPPSPMKEIGSEVYEGILTALDRSTSAEPPAKQVALEVRDTEREPGVAVEEAKALADDRTVIGILGPVFSNTTTAVARVAAASGIPLVTPTANQNGIAALGTTIFQANPDYEQRGRAMARYAVERLGCRILATLSPSDTYAKFLADGFVEEARALGAEVIAVAWYQKGATDLAAQLIDIRRAGFGIGPEPQPGLADSIQHGLTAIQALYCPISSPDEIGVVASQVAYYNIRVRLLGSGEWNQLNQLEANRRYCTGLRFESDSYVDTSTAAYKEFHAAFTARFRKEPGRNTLFGYDAASLMLSLIRGGAVTRETLAGALRDVHAYRGLKGRIGFSGGRVNTWVNILEYTEDGIVRVDEAAGEP